MKILYFGKSIRGIKCLEALVENGRRDEIIGVVTPPGMMDEMAQKAKKMGFQILQPERVNGEECIKKISSLNTSFYNIVRNWADIWIVNLDYSLV